VTEGAGAPNRANINKVKNEKCITHLSESVHYFGGGGFLPSGWILVQMVEGHHHGGASYAMLSVCLNLDQY
jgi:hypothetical protein